MNVYFTSNKRERQLKSIEYSHMDPAKVIQIIFLLQKQPKLNEFPEKSSETLRFLFKLKISFNEIEK